MSSSTTTMQNFKEAVMTFSTRIYSQGDLPNPQKLGIALLAKVIPAMEANGDVAFAWGWGPKDVLLYNQQEYETETATYVSLHKMKCDKGDTTWFHDYTSKGKKRRAILTTEIWYTKGQHSVSPIAYLFRQFMAAGLHITKVRFEDQPAAE
tara:strand:- start:1034 stop:1486 length:453 start_codon:yes stop_codon:yes gene_type:complete